MKENKESLDRIFVCKACGISSCEPVKPCTTNGWCHCVELTKEAYQGFVSSWQNKSKQEEPGKPFETPTDGVLFDSDKLHAIDESEMTPTAPIPVDFDHGSKNSKDI